jgi:small conductance mechanosensitive channel
VADDTVCRWLWEATGQAWLAVGSRLALAPLRIALIVLLALIVRHLLQRATDRLVRSTADGGAPAILRPLRVRLPASVKNATAIRPERRRQRAEAVASVLRGTVTVFVLSLAALLILGELGVNLAPLLTGAGIVGLALGFGAQSLVKDLVSGLFMLLEDQYGVGDRIDVGQASGTVEAVGLRITTIRDDEGVLWYIRNGEILRVGNHSQGPGVTQADLPIKPVTPPSGGPTHQSGLP